jgi:hypothetical protein
LPPGVEAWVVTFGEAAYPLRRQTDTSSRNSRIG